MPNIQRTHAAVVACHASRAALDSLPALPNAYACRVAPDELWLVAPPELLADTERCAAEHFSRTDPTALVLDQSDGWTTFTLRGSEGLWVFAQLSAIPVPSERPAFVQGAVAGGGAKVLLLDGAVHVLVPSTLRHHLTARLRDVSGIVFVSSAETSFLGDETTLTSPMRLSTPALR
ncbi:MAG: hypothetical protein ACREOG_04625 [Gemmatimonadaceae bacterium]